MLVLVIGDLHIPHRAIDLPIKFKKLLVPGKIQQILTTGNICNRETYDYLRSVAPDVVFVRGDMDEYVPPNSTSSPIVHVNLSNPSNEGISSSAPTPTATSDHPGNASSGPETPTLSGRMSGLHLTSRFKSSSALSPDYKIVHYGAIKIGIMHGHQIIPWGDAGSLSIAARQLDVDVLVTGHTHSFHAFEHEGRFFVNPGSATGAFTFYKSTDVSNTPKEGSAKLPEKSRQNPTSPTEDVSPESSPKEDTATEENPDEQEQTSSDEVIPTFVLMDIQGTSIVLYIYKLIDGEIKVEKLDYQKGNPLAT